MWVGVRQRFRRFHSNLLLTQDQADDGWAKQLNVRRVLQRAYYGIESEPPVGLVVGSWGKATAVRPPRDVDIFFVLPASEFTRFENHSGNKQSALLQDLKNVLSQTYTQTGIRGDGQVVMVAFNTITVEVVPVFLYESQYVMPDTNAGGRWKMVDPVSEMLLIETIDRDSNRNLRPMAQMLKTWKRACSVPLKSYQLELLLADFMSTYAYREYDYYWYDWYMRDFFQYLCTRAWTSVVIPGTGESVYLGADWLSRAESARNRALRACDLEYTDQTILAGEEWQKIFGNQIPIHII